MLVGFLASFQLCFADDTEDPAIVVRRTYGWSIYSDNKTHQYSPTGQTPKQLLAHKDDFAPEMFRLLKAVADSVEEYQTGKRKRLAWDNDPLTWSDSVTFTEPLKIRTISKLRNTAVVQVSASGVGPRTKFQTAWEVDLVRTGLRWQIANLRFPTTDPLCEKNVLKELQKNFHY